MGAPLSQPDLPEDELARRAGQIARLEQIASAWDAHHAGTFAAIKAAIEELNCEAFRRLIRMLREDPACAVRLNAVVRDPYVFGVLRFHGLVKDPLEHRVETALEEVRPYLHMHGGDVELVAVIPPDTVDLRLVGSCHGCPASSQTLSEGVERAIRNHCPEVRQIRQVSQPPARHAESDGAHVVNFVSPFAQTPDVRWAEVCGLHEIPDGEIVTREIRGHALLLYRRGPTVSCVENACAHMGMPLDGGELLEGTLRCPHHGFTYLLETGECLTVPEVQLRVFDVKVTNASVCVRVGDRDAA
jgi:Fe-S cluster biogenesis protein NfuA/nitrite reductase/ring-hydroxylating ferredoxin subunit